MNCHRCQLGPRPKIDLQRNWTKPESSSLLSHPVNSTPPHPSHPYDYAAIWPMLYFQERVNKDTKMDARIILILFFIALGMTSHTKTHEFLEKSWRGKGGLFQHKNDTNRPFQGMFFNQLPCWTVVLQASHGKSRTFVAISAIWFSKNEGGGSKAVWNFSESSSILVCEVIP